MVRRTASAVQAAIETAVLAELDERGYHQVTFEGVARRAGTSKPVLYRRYPSRAAMVLAALGATLRAEFPPALPGDLRGDLLALLRYSDTRARSVGLDTFRGLIGELDEETLAPLSGAIVGSEQVLAEQVIKPAVRRGELGPAPMPPAVLRVPFSVAREQFLFRTDRRLSLEEIVDDVVLPLFRAVSRA